MKGVDRRGTLADCDRDRKLTRPELNRVRDGLIRIMRAKRVRIRELEQIFNVSNHTIYRALNGMTEADERAAAGLAEGLDVFPSRAESGGRR